MNRFIEVETREWSGVGVEAGDGADGTPRGIGGADVSLPCDRAPLVFCKSNGFSTPTARNLT